MNISPTEYPGFLNEKVNRVNFISTAYFQFCSFVSD